MTTRAERLLERAIVFRDASRRSVALPKTYDDVADGIEEMRRVLLHEAAEAFAAPLDAPPDNPIMHVVDLHSETPGIVDVDAHVLRRGEKARPEPLEDQTIVVPQLADMEREAAKAMRREEQNRKAKEKRAAESPTTRAARLEKQRAARKLKKESKASDDPPVESVQPSDDPPVESVRPSDDPPVQPFKNTKIPITNEYPDVSSASVLSCKKVKVSGAETYYAHPAPHDRHVCGMQYVDINPVLRPPLLNAQESDALEIFHGPPGTGKTRALVERIASLLRDGHVVLACAPTNVGAANLYERCLRHPEVAPHAALVLAPDRVPPSTVIESSDPSRRVVCTTVSARSGALHTRVFDAVCLDEAAQCMEAWTWTLLRHEVRKLVMAGDTRQLPAVVSESGRALHHETSIMHRLGEAYGTHLTVQHRMAPPIMEYVNSHFYEGRLVLGEHAPKEGSLEWIDVPGGTPERVGTSFRNVAECERVAEVVKSYEDKSDVVIISPYAAQCAALLARKTGCEVHTVDSFQGRERRVVVLSIVRTADDMGFWNDPRRACVAFSRARERLVVVRSV